MKKTLIKYIIRKLDNHILDMESCECDAIHALWEIRKILEEKDEEYIYNDEFISIAECFENVNYDLTFVFD